MTNPLRLALIACFFTLCLIALGAVVRATGSGLGCPDWPLCNGGLDPSSGSHHTAIEFSHRVLGSVVGLLAIGTAVAAWRSYHASIVTGVAVVSVALVGLAGVLGGITVLRELPPALVATHLMVAMLALAAQATVVVLMYRSAQVPAAGEEPHPASGALIPGLLGAAAWLLVLMWVGAYMAESGASTACSGWPTCNGSLLPAADDQEIVHMAHRYLAAGLGLVMLAPIVAAWRQRHDQPWSGFAALGLAGLYLLQILVGATNVWATFPDFVTVAHTVAASLLWLTLIATAGLSFEWRPLPRPVPALGSTS